METEETITPCGLRKQGGLDSTHAEPAKKESQLFSNTRSDIYENTWRHSHKHRNVGFASFVTEGSTFVWDGRHIRDQTSFMEGSA